MRRIWLSLLALLLGLAPLVATVRTASAQQPLDFALPNGRFFSQANGQSGVGGTGYSIVDAIEFGPAFGPEVVPFFTAFNNFGNVPILGFPASRVNVFPDFPIQVCQKLVLQFQPGRGIFFLNVFDIMHDRGFDTFLDVVRAIPPPFDTSPDRQLPNFDAVIARHLAFLDQDPAIRAVYFSVLNPVAQFGLPMGFKDYGNVFVVRAQRAAFQHWRVDVGPNKAGSVTIVNGGDIGKEVGIFPALAVIPVGPPVFSNLAIVLLPGASSPVRSGFAATGYARFFEAAGNFELRNATGQVIASGPARALSGPPSFARFDFTVSFTVSSQQAGTLVVFDPNIAGGAVTVPLTLSP